jgi:DNA-binding NtrC family response regulator
LTAFFLNSFSRAFGRDFRGISPEALNLIEHYAWPGNIRELRNVIERICIMKYGPELLSEYLPVEIRDNTACTDASSKTTASRVYSPSDIKGLDEAVMEFEREIICQALTQNKGNVLQTAIQLKIPRGTLRYKMEKYGL